MTTHTERCAHASEAVLQGHFITTRRGWRFHFHEQGNGPALVLLHGSGPGASGWSNFKGNIDALAAAGHRVIVPDALGYGYSDKPTNEPYSLAFLNAGLYDFLDALGLETCALIGNSLGGAMALQAAIDLPSRIGAVIALGPGGLADFSVYLAMPGIKAMLAAATQASVPNAAGLRKVFELQLYDPSLITEQLLEERLAILKLQPQHVFETLRVPDLSSRMGEIQCPVLVFWGTNDNFCPVDTHRVILEGCGKARAILINQCGHWVQLEYQHFFNQTCGAFLAEHSAWSKTSQAVASAGPQHAGTE